MHLPKRVALRMHPRAPRPRDRMPRLPTPAPLDPAAHRPSLGSSRLGAHAHASSGAWTSAGPAESRRVARLDAPATARASGRPAARRAAHHASARAPGARDCHARPPRTPRKGARRHAPRATLVRAPFIRHRKALLRVAPRRSSRLPAARLTCSAVELKVGVCGQLRMRVCFPCATPPCSRTSPVILPPPAGAARLSATNLVDALPHECRALHSLCAPPLAQAAERGAM